MIPKIIHYCWFGKNKKSPLVQKCIASWKHYCKDYDIREWNEDTFDIESCSFTKEAYAAKKWAFVSDYARLSILKKHGGIYVDTDVEIIRPLDCFLQHKAFSGFENNTAIPTGIMGAEAGNPWIAYLLTYYDKRHFISWNGKCNTTTNVKIITRMTKNAYPFHADNTYQELENVVIYPKEYFCPKDYTTGQIHCTENTYCIHHFNGSWKRPGETPHWIERIKRIWLRTTL